MEAKRSIGLMIITPITLALAALVIAVLVIAPSPQRIPRSDFTIGLIIGTILGFLMCKSLSRRWDPENLRSKNANAKKPNILLTVATGVGFGFILIVTIQIGVPFAIANWGFKIIFLLAMIAGTMSAFSVTLLGYIIVQVWLHRPKP